MAALGAFCLSSRAAQDAVNSPGQPMWDMPLRHGTLTLWMVTRASTDDRLRIGRDRLTAIIQPSKVSVEKTMSEFGTPASDAGQTSSSYGQTSGSFGTAASDTGQTAGSVGKGPSELGASASTYGQTSGSYGQTAGSFGTAASSYGTAASDSNKPELVPRHVQDAQQDTIVAELHQAFPSLTVRVANVTDLELKDKLAAVKGTAAYPDAVVGVQYMPWWWQSGLGETMLGEQGAFEQGRSYRNERYQPGTIDLLRGATHTEAARAFWVWVSGAARCSDCGGDGSRVGPEVPVELAKSALQKVLAGAPLGSDADKDAAVFAAQSAQGLALAAYVRGGKADPPDLKVQVETISGFAVGRVAAVSLRAIAASSDAFGTLNALVVLRKDAAGRWKVLQISPNEPSGQRFEMYEDLRAAVRGKSEEAAAVLKPVSLASPQDGETRPEHPELWWDNGGQARLQVVEWQTALGSGTGGGVGWSATRLLPVVDTEARVQTKVTASFAVQGATIRWRVWSVGRGGDLALTGWRTFHVAGH